MEPIAKFPQSHDEKENFVTVVSIGSEPIASPKSDFPLVENGSGYVTVLTIGEEEGVSSEIVEQVLVYRLPGERLGFGLKFEGGTKSEEFVKRLFIQSCATDSPASRVHCSWGKLNEGDEVLEIDSIPVNTMTRIDCVRCLKDSNVVIKLLVRHICVKNVEDVPLVVGAEKKQTPPPPPPVPPRKISKKFYSKETSIIAAPLPASRQLNNNDLKKNQSPRNSGRWSHSPDVARRDRRFSDGSLGPPDAEVYVDLFSQECAQSTSESDDTGSSISTVVDRFGSFPTTTASSLAGSLPSTPTSIQKHLDLSNLVSNYDDDDPPLILPKIHAKSMSVKMNTEPSKVGDFKESPACFQDAPLSYGNEDMRITDFQANDSSDEKISKKPPVPPRSRDLINQKNTKNLNIHDENMNISNLPRLVDFVPKTRNILANDSVEMLKIFLENERKDAHISCYPNCDDIDETDDFRDDDFYCGTKWIQLSTIGEVEEDSNDFNANSSTPTVIVENADDTPLEESNRKSNGSMEALPSDSRQPPDGHEFPDYVETNGKYSDETTSSFYPKLPINKLNSVSNTDLTSSSFEENARVDQSHHQHVRAQSLIDVSVLSKQKPPDRWSQLAEQRKKGYSKLKGLVIPENVAETEPVPSVIIPEIISHTTQYVLDAKPNKSHLAALPQSEPIQLPLISPAWSSNNAIPKYSPAFKRKSLQVYPPQAITKPPSVKTLTKSAMKSSSEEFRLELSTEPPKSLESITSPTRSDCSFDYITTSKATKNQESVKSKESPKKFEDESDNDSAVSSSQSSYISRCSPPASPTQDDEQLKDSRLLPPASVEAINRKNILASAKCRSGRDFKVGSPVIQRKYEEEEEEQEAAQESADEPVQKPPEIREDVKEVEEAPVLIGNGLHKTEKVEARVDRKPEISMPIILRPVPKVATPKVDVTKSNILRKPPALSVTDLRKSFEQFKSPPPLPKTPPKVLKPVGKTIPKAQPQTKKVDDTAKVPISETAVNGKKLVLTPKFVGGSIGITLAGGTDYETKEITVHKIRYGSVAYTDGRLKKGDRIISINGKPTAGLTHTESVELLKESVAKFVLVVDDSQQEVTPPVSPAKKYVSEIPVKKPVPSTKTSNHIISLVKDGTGLGFSIEGGKDSLEGDLPLRIKKIFLGGIAEKSGQLNVGDELMAINDVDLTSMSKIEAWSLMKKLPDGNIKINIHR